MKTKIPHLFSTFSLLSDIQASLSSIMKLKRENLVTENKLTSHDISSVVL